MYYDRSCATPTTRPPPPLPPKRTFIPSGDEILRPGRCPLVLRWYEAGIDPISPRVKTTVQNLKGMLLLFAGEIVLLFRTHSTHMLDMYTYHALFKARFYVCRIGGGKSTVNLNFPNPGVLSSLSSMGMYCCCSDVNVLFEGAVRVPTRPHTILTPFP